MNDFEWKISITDVYGESTTYTALTENQIRNVMESIMTDPTCDLRTLNICKHSIESEE